MSAHPMLRALCCSVVTAATLAAAERAAAQVPAALPIADGTRARVTAPALGPTRRVVTVLAQRGDTLVLRAEGARDSLLLPAAGVTRLEVSHGRKTRVQRGLVVGLLGGAAVGAALAYAAYDPDPCAGSESFACVAVFSGTSRGQDAGLGAALGAVAGAAAGSVVGLLWRTERWQRVPLPPRVARVRLAPTPQGGLVVGMTF